MRTMKKQSEKKHMEKLTRHMVPPVPHLTYPEVQQLSAHLLDLVNDNLPSTSIPQANEVYSLALMGMGLVGYTEADYRRVVNMHHAHIRLILFIDTLMGRLADIEETLEERGRIN